MSMRKAVGLAAIALMLCAGTASAEGRNVGKLSIGYQRVDAGESGWEDGISSRYWVNDNVGIEGNIFYNAWSYKYNDNAEVYDNSTLTGTVKVMYAPVVKENSRFYVGLEGGLGNYDYKDKLSPENDYTNTFWGVKPLIGVEYNFPGISELGLNFEVGYLFSSAKDDPTDDHDIYDNSGVRVGLGAHYYF